MRDFNTEVTQTSMKVFCDAYEFKNLVKDEHGIRIHKTHHESISFWKNNSFQNSGVIETDLYDFHKLTVTVMKTTFKKLKPNIIDYRDYRKCSNDRFRENLIFRLSTEKIRVDCNDIKNYSRGNNNPFINKTIKKVFMTRSCLRNIYLKNCSDINKREYKKQRNYCVALLRKTKTTMRT